MPSNRARRAVENGQLFIYASLLHGFIKKTPQTPKRDLDIARGRKAETEQAGEETQP